MVHVCPIYRRLFADTVFAFLGLWAGSTSVPNRRHKSVMGVTRQWNARRDRELTRAARYDRNTDMPRFFAGIVFTSFSRAVFRCMSAATIGLGWWSLAVLYLVVTPLLHTLHKLTIEKRIDFKLALLRFKSLNGSAPTYFSDLLHLYTPSRQLRSSADTWVFRLPFCLHKVKWSALFLLPSANNMDQSPRFSSSRILC